MTGDLPIRREQLRRPTGGFAVLSVWGVSSEASLGGVLLVLAGGLYQLNHFDSAYTGQVYCQVAL